MERIAIRTNIDYHEKWRNFYRRLANLFAVLMMLSFATWYIYSLVELGYLFLSIFLFEVFLLSKYLKHLILESEYKFLLNGKYNSRGLR